MPDCVNLSDVALGLLAAWHAVPGARTSHTRQLRRLPPHTLIRPPRRRYMTPTDNDLNNNGE